MSIPLIRDYQYDASIQKVWSTLVDQEQMKQWYFPQLQTFEPLIGYKFRFADDGNSYHKE